MSDKCPKCGADQLARDVLGLLLEGHSIVMLDYTNSSDPHWIAKPGSWTDEAFRGSTPFESLVALATKFNAVTEGQE